MVNDGYLVDSHREVLMDAALNDLGASVKDAKDLLCSASGNVLGRLPLQAVRMFGCRNCEWRDSPLCLKGFRSGKGHHVVKHSVSDGVCRERENYLKLFHRGESSRSTFTQWVQDYNQGLAQLMLHKDYFKLKHVEQRLGEVDERVKQSAKELETLYSEAGLAAMDDAEREYRALEKLRGQYRFEWFSLWKELMAADNRRLDRDAPKKIEVRHEHMSIQDFNRVLRGDSVDVVAEFTEEETDDGGVNGVGESGRSQEPHKLQLAGSNPAPVIDSEEELLDEARRAGVEVD